VKASCAWRPRKCVAGCERKRRACWCAVMALPASGRLSLADAAFIGGKGGRGGDVTHSAASMLGTTYARRWWGKAA